MPLFVGTFACMCVYVLNEFAYKCGMVPIICGYICMHVCTFVIVSEFVYKCCMHMRVYYSCCMIIIVCLCMYMYMYMCVHDHGMHTCVCIFVYNHMTMIIL